ncbi:hypothetical protein MLD38_022761 [Melastoma candidum]|nr:hypothetical protein MLD38_022761 [Melastoma candidum]
MGQNSNSNSGGDSGPDVDLRGVQVDRNPNNAFILEENSNPGNDISYNPSLELPSQNQLLNKATSSGGKLSNGFDTLDFEFQNNQASSKLESGPQPENILPFSAKLGHVNVVNSHGVTLKSGCLENQNNQITFRSEDSPQPHVSAYSPRLGSASMITSRGVPLASGGLEDQRSQMTVKPEDAEKHEAVSVHSAMLGPTHMTSNHGVPLAPSVFGGRRNQNTLKSEGITRSEDVLVYSTTSVPTDMIASHGVPGASSSLECHRNQIALEFDETRQPMDVSSYSARLGPTGIISHGGVPIASAGIEVQRSQLTLKSQDARQAGDISAYSARLGPANMMNSHGVRITSNGEIWQPASVLHSGYSSGAGFSNSCTAGLTLPELLIRPEHQGQWNSIECSLPGGAELLQGQTYQGSSRHFQEPDQNDFLQSIFKGQGVISYNHEQKYPGPNFQQSNNILMGNSRIPDHFPDQRRLPLPMEPGHKAGNAIYMPQNVVDNCSSSLISFPPQGQEQLLPTNIPDWPINSVRFSESLACSIPSGDLSSQNWFTGKRYVRGGWTASGSNCAPSESLGNLEQSLYSVLPPCNQLRSTAPYNSIGQADQFMPSRTYEMGGRNVSGINNALPHSVQSLDYMNRRDAINSLVSNDPGWMNLPQQNPGLNDATGKPFMGSWDQ